MGWTIVFISLILPPLGLPLGLYGIKKDFTHWKKYIFCMVLTLGAVAYSFHPTGSPDLVTYFEHFETFGKMTLREAVGYTGKTNRGLGTSLYAAYAFYWIIGRIGDYHIAPAVSTIIIYYIGYFITCRFAEKTGTPVRKVLKYLIFMTAVINLYGIVNNIRNVLAFALIGYAVFRDCYEKKRNLWTLFLYILPIFLHPTAILFILMCIALLLPRKSKRIVAILLLAVRSIINYFYEHMTILSGQGVLMDMIRFAVRKGHTFYNETVETSGEWGRTVANSGSLLLSRICYISIALLFVIIAVWNFRKRNKAAKEEKKPVNRKLTDSAQIYIYAVFLGATTLSTVTMLTPEYWRFFSAFALLAGIIYLSNPYGDRSLKIPSVLFRLCFFVLTPVCTALWIRNFITGAELIPLVTRPFIASPVIVFLTCLI